MFGKILVSSDILGSGNTYNFTFASGEWLFLHGTATIQSQLQDRMSNLGQIVSVSRGLFSDHYVVTILSTSNESLDSWLSAFDVSWRDMGYNSITFVTSEEGVISTQPGGLTEILPSVGSTIGTTVGTAVQGLIQPIFKYVLIGIAVYAGIQMLPKMIARRRRY